MIKRFKQFVKEAVLQPQHLKPVQDKIQKADALHADNFGPERHFNFTSMAKRDMAGTKSHMQWSKGDIVSKPMEVNLHKEETNEEEDYLKNENPHMDIDHENEYFEKNNGSYMNYAGRENPPLEEHRRHNDTLNSNHQNAVNDYKVGSYDINSFLRKKTDIISNHDYNNIKHLDEVTSHKLEQPHIGFRGLDHNDISKEIHKMPVGHEFVDKGFTGTSARRSMGHAYSAIANEDELNNSYQHPNKPKPTHEYHYLKIHMPAGTKGYYLDIPHFDNPHSDENEILLHRGTRFKVLGHTSYKPAWQQTKYHVTHLKVIGHEPEPYHELQKRRKVEV